MIEDEVRGRIKGPRIREDIYTYILAIVLPYKGYMKAKRVTKDPFITPVASWDPPSYTKEDDTKHCSGVFNDILARLPL